MPWAEKWDFTAAKSLTSNPCVLAHVIIINMKGFERRQFCIHIFLDSLVGFCVEFLAHLFSLCHFVTPEALCAVAAL